MEKFKRKKFKFLPIILALIFILIFSGCSAPASAPPADEPPAASQQPAGEQSDQQNAGQSESDQIETDIVAEAAKAYFANMPADIYKIDQNEFVDKVKANEDIFIMDIRQPDAYNEGHIKGAVNIPWGEDIAENLKNLPQDKPIYVYCYTGQTAGQTVALLNVAGFEAKSVNLGWNLGISKVEGVDEVTETTSNPVPEAQTEIKPEIQDAISDYFSEMAGLKGTTYANFKISEEDAKKALDSGDTSIMFLSIRSAEDYAKGHIEGAVNIPFGAGMQESFDQLPKDKKIIVYCYTGQTAGQTVAILRLLGYDAVSLNSGMGTQATGSAGWANKGFVIVQ